MDKISKLNAQYNVLRKVNRLQLELKNTIFRSSKMRMNPVINVLHLFSDRKVHKISCKLGLYDSLLKTHLVYYFRIITMSKAHLLNGVNVYIPQASVVQRINLH